MSDKPFFRQLDDLDALIAEANEQEHERLHCKCMESDCPHAHFDERPRERVQQDIPPNVRTVRAMRNRRRVIE